MKMEEESVRRAHATLQSGPYPMSVDTLEADLAALGIYPKGGGKGKGKGKSKGKGKTPPPPNCSTKTPDGKQICFKFNTHGGCDVQGCHFAHVCGTCFKKGSPMGQCAHKN